MCHSKSTNVEVVLGETMIRCGWSTSNRRTTRRTSRNSPIPAAELYARYENLYTPAVSDALRHFTRVDRALPREITPVRDDKTVAGITFTATCAPDSSIEGSDELETRAELLAEMDEETVCVWSAPGNQDTG